MDQERFDQLARAFSGVKSRRAAVRVAIGSLLGGVGIGAGAAELEAKKKRKKGQAGEAADGEADAAAERQSGKDRASAQGKKKGKGKGKNKDKGGSPEGSTVPATGCPGGNQVKICHCALGNLLQCQAVGNGSGHEDHPVDCCCNDPDCDCTGNGSQCCKPVGTTCGNSNQCCTGECVNIDAQTLVGHCCATGQVWDPVRNQCCTAGNACTGTNCGQISNNTTCNRPQTCTCTNSAYECIENVCTPPVTCAESCTDGCCNGETCVSPPTNEQCGTGGEACTACTGATPFCVDGDCVACRTVADCTNTVGQCQVRTCVNGVCGAENKGNGTACNDGNACTQTDTCQNGACVGSNPVVCTPLDQCHDVGVCNPSTGVCSNPTKPNGTACNDGNLCTQTDTCQAGVCTGGNPVQCVPLDACHVAGTCNPATGQCTNPAGPGGNACSVGQDDGCCVAGNCNTDIVSCGAASPQCCAVGAICFNNQCCTPAGQQAACLNKCGTVVDSCGVSYECGACPPQTCKVGTCGTDSTCTYANAADGTDCLEDGSCCSGTCCDAGDVCYQEACCTPAGQAAACDGKCGAVIDSCGVRYDCGPCAPQICKVGTCGTDSTCSYQNAAQETPCGQTEICCNGVCCDPGNVCAVDGGACCKPAGQAICSGRCGTVIDSCGIPYDCGACPLLTCKIGTCGTTSNICTYVNEPQETPCDVSGICCNGECCDDGDVCAIGSGACCTPETCTSLEKECGSWSDGCGTTLECGTCEEFPNSFCTEGGTCDCAPATTCPTGQNCGTAPDGCGGVVECGVCVLPQTCGGGGTAGVCGCTPLTCASFPDVCGFIGLGCGITAFCDLGCASCTPDCTGKECGDDGCGGSCGTCPDGSDCIEGTCSAQVICIEEPETCDPASGLPCCGVDGQGVGTCSFGHCCADPNDIYDSNTGTCGNCVSLGGSCIETECCQVEGQIITCLNGICTATPPAPGNCAHAGERPTEGQRCCDRLHLEQGRCVINRWDHCDPRNRGKSSFCERGTRCIGGRLSPHGTPVCVPKKKRRGRGGESLTADLESGYTPVE